MLWTFGEGRSSAAVKGTALHGNGLLNSPRSSYLQFVSSILGRANASPSNTQGGSPVRESRPLGSVRGVLRNGHPSRYTGPLGPVAVWPCRKTAIFGAFVDSSDFPNLGILSHRTGRGSLAR